MIYDSIIVTGSAIISGSLTVTGGITGSIQGTAVSASYATTASIAVSSSYALSSSNAESASYAPDTTFPYTGSAIISGSLGVTGSVGLSYLAIAGTWTAGGAMITVRRNLAGAGTSTAALAFGGYTPGVVACTETYNGTSWSAGGALIIARDGLAGAGTQTAALAFGGYAPGGAQSCTETYNGTSWTSGGAMIEARRSLAGAGTSTAALAFGGSDVSTVVACTEAYNGSSWSAGGALSTARYELAGAGTNTAALAFGGAFFDVVACTEAYNGSSWSAVGALITGRRRLAGAGTNTVALAFGGYLSGPSYSSTACTEAYNGTSWTAGGAMITARQSLAGAGIQAAALAFGGYYGGACTEAYIQATILTKTFDYSNTTGQLLVTGSLFGSATLAATASYVTGSIFSDQLGVNNLALSASFAVSASYAPPVSPFPFSGSAQITGSLGVTGSVEFGYLTATGPVVWSEGGAMITARQSLAGAGTNTAALAFGGYYGGQVTCTETYNGTSWTAGGAMIIGRSVLAGAGTSTAALAFGGQVCACTETYNGTSWATGGAMITARFSLAGAGTNTAALAFGGYGSSVVCTCTETYNGTSWSAGGALSTARYSLAGAGTNTAALAFGGNVAAPTNTNTTATETYNGSSWSSGGAMIEARRSLAGAGTSTSALAFGGSPGGACTEAYNGATWTAGNSMINARFYLAGAGASNTAALAFGGYTGGILPYTETYNPSITSTKTFDYSATTGNISATGSLFGTASFASTAIVFPYTGSAIISGSLNVTGSITATGTLTAQTLVVQTVTSSIVYSSGSNIFGNALSNTQVMTGSVGITGSLAVIGNVGVGITSPAAELQVGKASDVTIAMSNSNSVTSGTRGNIVWYNSSVSTVAAIKAVAVTDNVGTELQFYTRPAAGSLTQVLTISSTGAANFSNSLRIQGSTVPTSGSGTELAWDGTNGYLLAFNRTTSAYLPLYVQGSSLNFTGAATFSSSVQATSLGMNVAPISDRILYISANLPTTGASQFQSVMNGTVVNAATTIYGMYVGNNSNVNVTNSYAIYIETTGGSGTITNKYGIYQASSGDKNYFAGNVLIGTTTSTSGVFKLEVGNGTSDTRIYCNSSDAFALAVARSSNSIFYLGADTSGNGIFSNSSGTAISNINRTTGTYTATSDVNKKKDFESSTIGLNAILGLKPTLYRMKSDDTEGNKELGFIAQEVKDFIPQAYVENDNEENKFIGLNYNAIIPVLVKAIQEQQAQIQALLARIETLENK
jgi:hypothetical protein